METKACNLTESEIKELILHHGRYLDSDTENRIERMNYLNKRLKAFSDESEKPKQPAPIPTPPSASQAWGNQ